MEGNGMVDIFGIMVMVQFMVNNDNFVEFGVMNILGVDVFFKVKCFMFEIQFFIWINWVCFGFDGGFVICYSVQMVNLWIMLDLVGYLDNNGDIIIGVYLGEMVFMLIYVNFYLNMSGSI